MVVDSLAYRFGYKCRAATIHCPHCGGKLRRYYNDAERRQYSQCLSPTCPAIAGQSENELINAVRLKQKQSQTEIIDMTTLTVPMEPNEVKAIPSGKYLMQIIAVEEGVGTYGPQVVLKLEVISKEQKGESISYLCSLNISHPDSNKPSNLTLTANAAYNRKLQPGEVFNPEHLQNRKLVVLVGIKETGWNSVLSVESYKSQEPFPLPGAAKAKKTKVAEEFDVGEAPPEEFDEVEDPFSEDN